ncbi:hypothetical protein G7B40_012020 [Aetokthonos hydrillicola Thurmond2011]|uniref:Uncharacterized protein n=2 Tax=Aetokthonos TaxID=1550243 RepID=A0AAP5I818_9CYAN|nr:hypothetical protein [Aetokthonos hydrillicola]MDR9895287.1 hypothetical protein [Aetokthonos hydrillicola Thurmond2011]
MTTTDGTAVEINPDAITEIVKVQEEKPGFLFMPGTDAEYEIHMNDNSRVRVDQSEHDKLKQAD